MIEDDALQGMVNSSSSRFDLWQKVLNATKSESIVEIGVWKGDFAEKILSNCGSIQKYYMIDPWATLPDWNKPFNVDNRIFDDVYAEAMRKTDFASEKIHVLRGRTSEVIGDIPDESLDFAYIDGDHTLRGITIDLIRLFPKMKRGGLIAGDDFTSNPWQHGMDYEPTLVCPFSIYFAEAMGLPIVALPYNQFLIMKTSGAGFSFRDISGEYADISLNKLPEDMKSSGLVRKVKKVVRGLRFFKHTP